MIPAHVLAQVRRHFPSPWVIDWNEYEGVRQIEVNIFVEHKRRISRQWTGETWADAQAAMLDWCGLIAARERR